MMTVMMNVLAAVNRVLESYGQTLLLGQALGS